MPKRCRVETGWGADVCKRLVWEKDHEGLCFFHSLREKDPREFRERFIEGFERLQPTSPNGFMMITHFVFPSFEAPKGFEFSKPDCDINFTESRFTGTSDFKNARFKASSASFSKAVFDDLVDFSGTEFDCPIGFSNAVFQDEANFKGTELPGGTYFGGAELHRGAGFSGAFFRGYAGFDHAEFGGKAEFRRAKMLGWVDFTNTVFKGEADFGNADFSKALFLGTEFRSDVNMGNAKFRNKAYFPEAHFKKQVNLLDARFLGEFDFREAIFEKGDFDAFELTSRRKEEWSSKLDHGTSRTFDDLLDMAKHLRDDVDPFEVPTGLDNYTHMCKMVFSREGEEASATFLKRLDEEKMVHEIAFIWWAYYGAVKAFVDIFGECPQLLVALSKSCMDRLTPDEEEAKYFVNRALTIDPDNYWVVWDVLLDRNPAVWTERMYKKAGMGVPPWTWEEQVQLLDKILEIKPNDLLGTLLRENVMKENKTISELGPDFWNEEISPRYPWGSLHLKRVLAECAKWKKRHKTET
jgi:uncharacterized protein YjbI with pentapeptide repeats